MKTFSRAGNTIALSPAGFCRACAISGANSLVRYRFFTAVNGCKVPAIRYSRLRLAVINVKIDPLRCRGIPAWEGGKRVNDRIGLDAERVVLGQGSGFLA